MDDKVLVQNLTNDPVVYIDNHGGVVSRIVFNAQQEMTLPRDMVERMSYDIGGSSLLKDYLSVKDEVLRQQIGIPEDQYEYDYTAEDVKQIIKDNDADAIADALDFGPEGIKEMIVEQAVALPVQDRGIADMIKDKIGKNIEAMIKNKAELDAAQAVNASAAEAVPTSGRRKTAKPKTETKMINGKKVVIPVK